MISTTGTSIETYLSWVKQELEKKDYGEVSITFTIHDKQVVDVKKMSVDNEHFPLKKKNDVRNNLKVRKINDDANNSRRGKSTASYL